jgi:hypothetical protein
LASLDSQGLRTHASETAGNPYAPGEAQVGLADRVFARYQGLVEEEYAAGLRAQAAGRLTPPPGISAELHLGQYVDRAARTRLIGWLRSEGIGEGPGELIQVNRYLRDPLGSGAYRIPDIGIPGSRLIFDGTISSSKTIATPQMIDFRAFSGGSNIIIVRPTELGGSYGLVFP